MQHLALLFVATHVVSLRCSAQHAPSPPPPHPPCTENMRREGFELSVSPPRVVLKAGEKGEGGEGVVGGGVVSALHRQGWVR